MSENVFEAGDPFEDPAWKETEKPKRKRRNGRLIGCPLPWFVWVFPLVKSKEQLGVALYLYRRCCICSEATVTVPTAELTELRIGRWAKYRLLLSLEKAGILRIINHGRRTMKVRLCYWPDPPS